MKGSIQLSLFLLTLLLASCGQNNIQEEQERSEMNVLSETERTEKLALADSISNIAQVTLLQNVGSAMKIGGPVHAVDFCNINAVPLMDSVSKAHQVKVEPNPNKSRNIFWKIWNG